MRKSRGFTLIEMVVVLAVVAILAAILTPTIAKNINDAKISRANNEAQVIGAAIGSFFKDVGRWPTAGTTLADTQTLLYSNGGTDPAAADAAVTDEEVWVSTTAPTTSDTFENHLVSNAPAGVGDADYPITGELRWRGPYITEIKADPWGSKYSCNIGRTYTSTTAGVLDFVGIYSAGPDRAANTSAIQVATAVTLGGDDILFRLQ